jgi:glycosyl-4,4'-diaponeurosporenoate acyltransferase
VSPAALIADLLLWPILIIGAGRLVERLPLSALDPEGWLYRTRSWETGGRVYERLGVKRWKAHLPDGAAVWRGGFRKKHLAGAGKGTRKGSGPSGPVRGPLDDAYLARFSRETCRAELVHWLMLPAWGLFWAWNGPVPMAVMGAGVLAANLPPIVAQRYNRARLTALLRRRRNRP